MNLHSWRSKRSMCVWLRKKSSLYFRVPPPPIVWSFSWRTTVIVEAGPIDEKVMKIFPARVRAVAPRLNPNVANSVPHGP